ncbi:MAG: hypothetical protein Edafosvirus36_8 [Edafosvirus sp.]|uniref:Uncharacterized protein n=1 Tax=Edafosvirus sp. TaxID=2487765 RepID=A0A3G4ZV92_9VIRU|nr:MAG: hypothetical protein Edafosvirus36_8 [Edafosvirus sp.]
MSKQKNDKKDVRDDDEVSEPKGGIKKDMDEDDEDDQISKDASSNHMNNEFREKVVTYIKIDDLVRKKKEEIKELQTKKKPCEEFLIRYLEGIGENIVQVDGTKLIKNKSETKEALKKDVIKDSILDKIKEKKLLNNDTDCIKVVEDMLDLMEQRRPMKIRTNIKRTFEKERKPRTKKKQANDKNKDNKDNNK